MANEHCRLTVWRLGTGPGLFGETKDIRKLIKGLWRP